MIIFKSIVSRFRQCLISHYSLTRRGKILKKFYNIHADRRCFIIGNGPSLRAEDLNILSSHNEITFAFNRVYHIFEKTTWRPTYYISQDDKILKNSWREIPRIEAKEKFIPIQIKWFFGIPLKGVSYYNLCTGNIINPTFSNDISKFVGNSATVVFTAMQFAVYMGIKEIYLIGVDHHFRTSRTADGKIVVDQTAKDYFTDEYNRDKDQLPIPSTELSTYTFIAAKEYADAHGIRIFNATRGGKLEVYPRVDFDTLF